MKYFKVLDIKELHDGNKDFTIGKIYETDDNGTNFYDDVKSFWCYTSMLKHIESESFIEDFEVYVEEVSRFEYEIQRFLNGEIRISFYENKHEGSGYQKWREYMGEYLTSVWKGKQDWCFDSPGDYFMINGIIEYDDYFVSKCEGLESVEISFDMWNEYKSFKNEEIEKVVNKKHNEFPVLEDNMIVKIRKDDEGFELGLVIGGKIIFKEGGTTLENYTPDLKNKYNKSFDIMEIGKRDTDTYSGFEHFLDIENFHPTWKRLEDREIGPIFLTNNGVDFTIEKTTQSKKERAKITLSIGDYKIDMNIADVFSIRSLCYDVINEYEEI